MFGTEEEPPPQSRIGGATVQPSGEEPAGSGPRGPHEGLILLLFTLLTIAASAYVLLSAEDDALSDPKQKAARGEVKGLSDLSLVREKNLRKVLEKAAKSKRPLVTNIRVSPARVDLVVRDSDGSRQVVSYDPGLGTTESSFGVGGDDALKASSIDPAAPERMLRAVTERTHLKPEDVDYVTMGVSGENPKAQTWSLFLTKGPFQARQWVAAADGTDVRRPGELSKAQKAETARQKREFEAQQRRFQRVLAKRTACINKATSAVAVSRCLERFNP